MELNPEDDNRATPGAALSRRVRRSREKAGLSLRDMATQIRFPHSYIHRVDSGKQLPSDDLAEALDRFFDVDGIFTELLGMARDASVPDYGRLLVSNEQKAVRIQTMISSVFPGLLQTADYARELIRAGHLWDSDDQVEAWVATRMRRQRMFERDIPPHYSVLLDEATLKRPIGGRRCMESQIKHLLRAAQSVYTSVQVVPFDAGAHSFPSGSATLLTMGDGSMIGHVEGVMVGEPVVGPDRLIKLMRKFDTARSAALPEGESVALIHLYLKGYEHGDSPSSGSGEQN